MTAVRRPSLRGATLALALLTPTPLSPVGCQDYLFEVKCPEAVTENRISQPIVGSLPVDILFVIDNSGSMADEQENLVRNFDRFVDVIAGGNLDYRLAVVSTDLGQNASAIEDGPESTGTRGLVVDGGVYRTVDNTDISACTTLDDVRHGCFRPANGNPWLDSQRDSPQEVIAGFSESARVGSCGSGFERGTSAMITALENTAPGECNEGFLRPEANLVVIIVSDEDDYDPAATPELLARLGAVKPLGQVRLALIGAVVDGAPSTCRTGVDGQARADCGSLCTEQPQPEVMDGGSCQGGCPPFFVCRSLSGQPRCVNLSSIRWEPSFSGSGCDSCTSYAVETCCAADVGAQAYVDFALAFEQAVTSTNTDLEVTQCRASSSARTSCLLDSICQSEFADTLERIAEDLVVQSEFILAPPASYPPGVLVRIEGGRFADMPRTLEQGVDYTISPAGDRVRIVSADLVPRADESLDIVYVNEVEIPVDPGSPCADR